MKIPFVKREAIAFSHPVWNAPKFYLDTHQGDWRIKTSLNRVSGEGRAQTKEYTCIIGSTWKWWPTFSCRASVNTGSWIIRSEKDPMTGSYGRRCRGARVAGQDLRRISSRQKNPSHMWSGVHGYRQEATSEPDLGVQKPRHVHDSY
jgi:hypothetical protein